MSTDVAGEVVELEPEMTRFKVGDLILGHAVGWVENLRDTAQGRFQQYTVLLPHIAARIPDSISYERYPSPKPPLHL